jgi:hypothetical protein
MLRHACGFALAGKGHDTRALQAYLGHKNIQHTVRYTELAPTASKTSGANRSRCRALEEGGQDCGANQHKTTCHRGNDERGLDLVHGCYPHHPESNTIGRCENSFSDLGHRAHRILWITCPAPLHAAESTTLCGILCVDSTLALSWTARAPHGFCAQYRHREDDRRRDQYRRDGTMNNIVLTDEEMQEEIRSAIVAHCDPITRDAVLAWFDRRVVIAQAMVELGLDRDAVA